MKTTLRQTIRCGVAFGCLGLALVGCRASTPTTPTPLAPGMVALPPIEREIGPDGREIVAAPAPDAQGPQTLTQKITAFCVPKNTSSTRQKSDSNRAFENSDVPYTD